MARWRRLDLGYDSVPLEPEAAFVVSGERVTVDLHQPAAIGAVRYAINGLAPSTASPPYGQPLTLPFGSLLSAQAYLGNTALGAPKRWIIRSELIRTRTASEMELCSNAIPLRLEDDGPTAGKRLVHWVDIMHPCWIWRGAPLDRVTRVVAQVGRLPFNFAVGEDIHKITFEPLATAAGELRVRRDTCDGPIVATIPLQSATKTSGVAEVTGQLVAQSGAHDLCMTFTQNGPDPFWVLDRLTLQP
jgi:hexosaminidase